MLPLLCRLSLLGGLERHVGDAAEGARRRRAPLPAAVEVGGGDDADGPLSDGEDLRGQVLAQVG
uniref:Uncharacterized protein n=1 Tax=Arundo donax TaxID=35708 RepID=A0A0A9BH89_ARUDO